MRVTFHIGAHRTDEDRLIRSLRANGRALAPARIAVPKPKMYRKAVSEIMTTLRGASAPAEAQELLIDASLGDGAPRPDHMILSNEHFLCVPDRVLDDGVLYARAFKAAWLRNLFPDHRVSFAIGLRDPATFIPALYAMRGETGLDFEDYLLGINPRRLSWADMIARLKDACQDAEITVWCNEDTPLLWPKVLRTVARLPSTVPLAHGTVIAEEIMRPDGAEGLRAYLAANPASTDAELRGIVAGFLERYAAPELIEEEIDLPGWTADLMAELSRRYDEDVVQIGEMPGVTLVSP